MTTQATTIEPLNGSDFEFIARSSSGNTYRITCTGSIDLPGHPAEYGLIWSCSCPARGSCHHLATFIAQRLEQPEQD